MTMNNAKTFFLVLFVGTIYCRYIDPLYFSIGDLHLDDVTDVSQHLDAKFLVKRATDAIMERDNDAKETKYEFSYKTDSHEHYAKGMVINGEHSVVGAYSVMHPDGTMQTTMYTADKNGYTVRLKLKKELLHKSLVG
ncbi:uncharacterized protein LOC116340299 [Contarinia nasturtii]|uniref:uncharacterized protein LOC116340299 n=1 Tax=Contarinia nasturtii TaxID=265458 RepID=UPI0012D3B498|nr:uncharacterized protein LOC116340299 [Contarinia nasturtii]